MGRPAKRTFRATQQWSWQEPHPKETRPKRYVHRSLPVSPAERQEVNSDTFLQEHGSGSADASQAEGHDSTLMARMTSPRQRQKQTQV